MVKHEPILHVPSFAEDPVDIPTSPEKEEMHVVAISEVEELVTETLKDLRREVDVTHPWWGHQNLSLLRIIKTPFQGHYYIMLFLSFPTTVSML
jgi:hypothetical protein